MVDAVVDVANGDIFQFFSSGATYEVFLDWSVV